MKTPIAFIIFNRPDVTKKVFQAIRQAKPPKLLVIADGARSDRPGEAKKCQATRAIIDGVDWECQVLTDYSDLNLGGMRRISSGLNWVFTQVERAIILEDDCYPHPSFFPFCEELLDRYQDDERVMNISGNNFQFGRSNTGYSYYYSRFHHCWGWATWSRAWQHYDMELKLWSEIRDGNWLEAILKQPDAVKYWYKIFQGIHEQKIDYGWDYRWTFACWIQNGLTVLPHINLVSNIGFGPEATHTIDRNSKYANLPTQEMPFPLKHPPFIIRHVQADNITQNTMFQSKGLVRIQQKIRQLKMKLLENKK